MRRIRRPLSARVLVASPGGRFATRGRKSLDRLVCRAYPRGASAVSGGGRAETGCRLAHPPAPADTAALRGALIANRLTAEGSTARPEGEPMPSHHTVLMLTAVLISMITPWVATAAPPVKAPTASLLVSGLQGATGSTVGPGGDLYVTEALTGTISRVEVRILSARCLGYSYQETAPACPLRWQRDERRRGRTSPSLRGPSRSSSTSGPAGSRTLRRTAPLAGCRAGTGDTAYRPPGVRPADVRTVGRD